MQKAFAAHIVRSLKICVTSAFIFGAFMKIYNPIKDLSKFEMLLWLTSIAVISTSFIITDSVDILTIIASIIGVTALIFVAKGYVIGQILTIVFGLFYGIVSFYFRYYGEMITYLGMTAPSAVAAVISWIKHPYKETKEVEVNKLNSKQIVMLILLTVVVTALFGYVLLLLNNANLFVSTISIATSFAASYLTFYRSPYYAVAYALNDVVLIVLWILAAIDNSSYFPMVLCFIMFLVNDLYGFYSWQRMKQKQSN